MKPNLLIAVALVLVPLSGCLSEDTVGITSNTAPTEEPASTVVVEPEKGVYVAENRGILRGTVFNDAGLGVSTAYVLIVGTDLSQVTDREGKFAFHNLTVGKKQIRVEAEGFQAAENETVVNAGNITEIEVFLLPTETTGAGYRQHVHDFWGDRDMVDIMDHDMDLRQNTGQVGGAGGTQTQRTISGVTYSLQNTTTDSNKFRIRLPGDGDPPALIFPGTKEIKVKITWAAPAFTGYKVGIGWRLPGLTQHTWLARQVSGSTWTIGVTPDMWDSGHQWYTLWEFYVYTHQDPAADGTNFRPGIITGNIHVKITVVKGEILPEPPHPKFWESGDTIEVSTHENVIDCSQYSYRLIERDYCRLYLRNGPRIIPPGTGKLRIEMKWNYGTYEGTPTSDLIAVYKPSNMNPWTTPVNEFLPASCTGTGQTRLCEITVKPGEADAYYQKSSSWYFTYAVKGHHEETGDQEFRPFKFTMHILAIKDPSFDEDRAGGA